jgi:hypothetical protein
MTTIGLLDPASPKAAIPHRHGLKDEACSRRRPAARIVGWTFGLAVAACLVASPSPAADPPASGAQSLARFDGNYVGTITLVQARGGRSSVDSGSGACETNTLGQKMWISGGQVYLDRKYNNPDIRLLLSGTVSPEGQVSAGGTTVSKSPTYRPFSAHLHGNMEGDEFNGELSMQDCAFSAELRKIH